MITKKRVGWALLIIIVGIQFIRPARNLGNNNEKSISTLYPVPANVQAILNKACNDCHSNYTVYPWYTNIQPVGWWLNHHVNEGKEKLNLSEFANYRIFRQYHKLDELIELTDNTEMPLSSYTWIHKDAILTAEEKNALTGWAKAIQDSMRATYPADSLVNPNRKPGFDKH